MILSPRLTQVLIFLVFGLGIILVTLFYRKSIQEKTFTYGESLGTGLIITFTVAFLIAVAAFIVNKYIEPFDKEKFITAYENMNLQNSGEFKGLDTKMVIPILLFIKDPLNSSLITFSLYFLGGSIISLLSSIFTRKK